MGVERRDAVRDDDGDVLGLRAVAGVGPEALGARDGERRRRVGPLRHVRDATDGVLQLLLRVISIEGELEARRVGEGHDADARAVLPDRKLPYDTVHKAQHELPVVMGTVARVRSADALRAIHENTNVNQRFTSHRWTAGSHRRQNCKNTY